MRFTQSFYYLFALITTISALALPAAFVTIAERGNDLFKRKGGGGGGGKGGGSGSSSGSSSGSGSSGSSSGSSGSTGSSSGSSGSSSSSGSRGSGSSGAASGYRPTYGGYYGGGASTPYGAGARSRGGVAPFLIGGAALAVFPGIWLYSVYAYPYGHAYGYRNNTSGRNETRNVTCLCEEYSQCGCDNNTDSNYLTSVANNQSISRVANDTLYVNGTLPNGTGTDDSTTSTTASGVGSLKQKVMESSGYWVVVAGVGYTMWLM
nr:hypothetical protein B0A51_02105 [Rachicladosporium sp. CCFEE 5018]